MKKQVQSDVNSFASIMKKSQTELLLFLLSLVVYFLVFIPMEHQTFLGMILKCLPIVALQYLVYNRGIGIQDNGSCYNTKILVGLIFACIGDAFLDFPNYFLHGTISFTVAQICNIWAFGFQPLNFFLGLKVFGIMSIPLYFVIPKLMKEEFMLLVAVIIYAPLLKTLVWRSIARVNFDGSSSMTKDWGKLFGCLGCISFGMSDATLGINRYYRPVQYAQAIIMVTYYLAQLGIAMSVVTSGKFNQTKTGPGGPALKKSKTKMAKK